MGNDQDFNGRILIVEDNGADLGMYKIVLGDLGHEIVAVRDIKSANDEVRKSLVTGKRFNLVCVDIEVGPDSGAEFAKRLMQIVVDANVLIVTGHYNPAADLNFTPDGVIIKDRLYERTNEALLAAVDKLMKPRRVSDNSRNNVCVQVNRWDATSYLRGITSLKLFTQSPCGGVEKLTSVTSKQPPWYVNTVIYPGFPGDDVVPVGMQSTIGCSIGCLMCLNPISQKNKFGEIIPYVRPLTAGEIQSEAYLAMLDPRTEKVFARGSRTGLVLNFSGAGDGLVNNLDNLSAAIWQMSRISRKVRRKFNGKVRRIEIPLASFIITSVGSETALKEYLTGRNSYGRYIEMPRVRHYWSVNSLDKEFREWLMPGTKGQSMSKMRDLHQEISRLTRLPTTASFVLFKGLSDRPKDVRMIADFFAEWPDIMIKLMVACPGSLKGNPDMSMREAIEFGRQLTEAGLKNVRFREIYGESDNSGCGRTEANFVVDS